MRVILFGATGMVGQGVMRECVLDPEVEAVLSVVRRESGPSLGRRSEKVRKLITNDFLDLSRFEDEFAGYDACLFCVGVSAVGMQEAEYRRVTYDMTLAAAQAVSRANPAGMTFIYVSGAGTNAQGRAMWSRVKGETENALLSLEDASGRWKAYMFRPGLIVPMDGIVSKTKIYRVGYSLLKPLLPMMLRWFPGQMNTTAQVGRAMIEVAKHGYTKPVLETRDIAQVG